MTIHACGRCDGCGYVTGGFRWEIAWTRWSPGTPSEADARDAQPCPDCGGTGALIELELVEPEPVLPSRRGLPVRNRYAQHVRHVLRSQRD